TIHIAILLVFFCAIALAQAPLQFEVASIRPSSEQTSQINIGLRVDGSQVRYTYLSLKDYISLAYDVKPTQIVGPDWLASQRFDIAAKLPEGGVPTQAREMLQHLITDRFQMKMHRENRDFNVYAITVAKAGLKMQELPPDPESEKDNGAVNISAGGNGGGASVNLG